MKRKIMQNLVDWMTYESNMPYMLIGARQVGKTYIINMFCLENYNNCIYINLEKEEDIKEVFESTLEPNEIIRRIAILKNIIIEPNDTIIFFDEIQVSERAIASLKYFNEAEENYNIVCAGSLLGVALNRFKNSYPVGKVRKETLFPMDFEEFLWAIEQEQLVAEITKCFQNNNKMVEPIHNKALSIYKDYLYVGGMPASVLEYINKNYDLSRYNDIVKQNIIEAYIFDMSKYTTSAENFKINKLYKSIPKQLNRESSKFTYKIIEDGANKRNYETSIDWLINSRLVNKCILAEVPKIPLSAYVKDGLFKVYLSDIGLLCALANITPKNLISHDFDLFRGMLTENYIAQVFVANGHDLYYWKSKKSAEVDFLLNIEGSIIPVEVKAATNTKSQSLRVYVERYNPKYSIRISAKNFGYVNKIKSVPLYAAFLLQDN